MESPSTSLRCAGSTFLANFPLFRAAPRRIPFRGSPSLVTSFRSSSFKLSDGTDAEHARFFGRASARRKATVVRRCQEVTVITDVAAPTSLLDDLPSFVGQGLLADKVGATPDKVAQRLDEWSRLGEQLAHYLKFDEDGLSEAELIRIYHYYLPVFFWCVDQLSTHRSSFAPGESVPAMVIGISAPQGCGKTTLVAALEYLLNTTGRLAATISIDDFYITGAEQEELAATHPDNGLMEFRGNAGSHDLQFGTKTIKTLVNLSTSGAKANVPRYNKSARNGRGDRADPSKWPVVEGPLQVVLFEGWMLGFEPQDDKAVAEIDSQLPEINKFLGDYHDAWHRFINSWIIVEVGDPSWVYQWRLEAEIEMMNMGKPGMSDTEIAEFVSRYMPAYRAYLPTLYATGPRNSTQDNTLSFKIDKMRNPVG